MWGCGSVGDYSACTQTWVQPPILHKLRAHVYNPSCRQTQYDEDTGHGRVSIFLYIPRVTQNGPAAIGNNAADAQNNEGRVPIELGSKLLTSQEGHTCNPAHRR